MTIYTHEVAVRTYNLTCTNREGQDTSPSPSHLEALYLCLRSCYAVLSIYLSYPIPLARCLPNLYLVWTVYAATLLIRLGHFQKTALQGPIAGMPETTTEQFLDALITRLGEISAEGYCLSAREFYSVFKKLKLWERHRKARHGQEDTRSAHLVADRGSKGISSKQTTYNARNTITWKDAQLLRESDKEVSFSPSNQSEARLQQPAVINPSRSAQDRVTATDINSPFEVEPVSEEVRWEDITFDLDETNGFDLQMEGPGWFSYLYDHRQAYPTSLR